MTHTNLISGGWSNNPNSRINRGIKGGVKLDFDMLIAFTKDLFFVPVGHPDALVFAGYTMPKPYSTDADMEANFASIRQEVFDNTNGQDGDKLGNANLGQWAIFANSLTQPLDVTLQDNGQIIYASGNRTLHTTPGKGRLPIGRYIFTDFAKDPDTGEVGTELVHWIDSSYIPARYKA